MNCLIHFSSRVLPGSRTHAPICLGNPDPAYGGLGRGEVMAADVGDYSREAPSLMVHGKGNKDRVVPLPLNPLPSGERAG